MRAKDEEAVQKVVTEKDPAKASAELDQLRQKHQMRFCEILKDFGWPSSRLVGPEGSESAFVLLQVSPSFELQRELLPLVIAGVQKGDIDRPHFAALFDRIRVRAGMKQFFGTQARAVNGLLVLEPIEDEAQVDDRRSQLGMVPLAEYIRRLERDYHLPLVRSPEQENKTQSRKTDSLSTSALSGLVKTEADDDVEVLRIETNLVNLNVSVYSPRLNATISHLEQKDFAVYENGQRESVTYFASTSVPFDMVLVLDLSGSTIDKRELIRQSTQRFIEAARPSDRIAIVTFSDDAQLVSPLTADRAQLLASISRIDATEGGSSVWDSVKFALDQLGPRSEKTAERRRAVVLMTDGVDNKLAYFADQGSKMDYWELVEAVRKNDAMIVPIYLDTQDTHPWLKAMYENARKTLRLLSDESGGLYYQAKKINDLNGVYDQVINDLGRVYSLGYRPTNERHDGAWRRVKVELLNHPELVPRTRSGYYAN